MLTQLMIAMFLEFETKPSAKTCSSSCDICFYGLFYYCNLLRYITTLPILYLVEPMMVLRFANLVEVVYPDFEAQMMHHLQVKNLNYYHCEKKKDII